MRNLFSSLVLILAGFSGAALAGSTQPVVVELYTSQGCSSCPPADALLADLRDEAGVIPLALHVDYWDYIGWKDIFADPVFTKRQKGYARAAGQRTVYTPQLIVNGADHVVGAKGMQLMRHIARHRKVVSPVSLRVEQDAQGLRIAAKTDRPAAGMVVQLVRFVPVERVRIKHGENAGRTLTYTNIVRSWQRLVSWDGDTPLSIMLEETGDLPGVVIVQEKGHGRILAATYLPKGR